jgi:hypothetical protein
VGLFTVNLELGDKTLETLTRVSKASVIRFELGPETRSMIERLVTRGDEDESRVAGLVKKGADVLRPGS